MKFFTSLTALLLACTVSYGQDEPEPVSEHLKCFGPFIGNWQYEGPMQEDFEGIAEEGTRIVVRTSIKRILNGSAIEGNWSIEFEGGAELVGKDLTR
ncbi:hypothetical protein NZK35_25270 [Stieleria sp. ICT_E10.1]|uniref:hypothetical protein n=1 Tax=Stieleria sedimenti TaxID=2976331 RepID=UPI00217F8435|nr:hypothetical protein [Stieleria sedimenti]MCS7469975.1 hypothetical protein [Stieleria sedimenti]